MRVEWPNFGDQSYLRLLTDSGTRWFTGKFIRVRTTIQSGYSSRVDYCMNTPRPCNSAALSWVQPYYGIIKRDEIE